MEIYYFAEAEGKFGAVIGTNCSLNPASAGIVDSSNAAALLIDLHMKWTKGITL
jgi:hypothetical protein